MANHSKSMSAKKVILIPSDGSAPRVVDIKDEQVRDALASPSECFVVGIYGKDVDRYSYLGIHPTTGPINQYYKQRTGNNVPGDIVLKVCSSDGEDDIDARDWHLLVLSDVLRLVPSQ